MYGLVTVWWQKNLIVHKVSHLIWLPEEFDCVLIMSNALQSDDCWHKLQPPNVYESIARATSGKPAAMYNCYLCIPPAQKNIWFECCFVAFEKARMKNAVQWIDCALTQNIFCTVCLKKMRSNKTKGKKTYLEHLSCKNYRKLNINIETLKFLKSQEQKAFVSGFSAEIQ